MEKKLSILIFICLLSVNIGINAQTNQNQPTFRKVKMMLQDGDKTFQKPVVVIFSEGSMIINDKYGKLAKEFDYADIEHAEYSYSKSPRWKTGLGMGAAGLAFPPLLLIAIPLGFTKHRRHWLTVRTNEDYAVLKLSKSTRKLFIPTFETRSGITVEAVGEDK